ncbi:DUF6903 family protein [Clostridium chauvoei]|uniref:Uncharacterized protein n=2 Tax=Clostridium chauvoei TaxID=46867 RepID=S6EV16_9CLOT|nr:hypothetical protein [Clostridium chauvoei]MBX7281796.1 hypothetical protein [Clostridium chauvoei]MBX7284311.1 hypothetical protein [Clostridium chauvoei]MBX7286825.1 hypothetical protein [Clostridium chauvoei]MBX7289360.1 hypothetical protein [Clostridium chauvoei]MBX7291874.1 hypothetical protein [Clostridium chauvoei]
MKKLIYAIVFFLSIFLVVKGNTMAGYAGLGVMFIGLAGILSELYLYNKRYQ